MKGLNVTDIRNDDAVVCCWSCNGCGRHFRASKWMLLFVKAHGHLWVSHSRWRDYGNAAGAEQFAFRNAGSEP
jgi:hypothetical protein